MGCMGSAQAKRDQEIKKQEQQAKDEKDASAKGMIDTMFSIFDTNSTGSLDKTQLSGMIKKLSEDRG